MVYDERSNYIGDTHWREDTAFDEGEELELERGGILVEVGECVGKRDQDLSELVDKRLKDREERAAAKGAASSPSRPHPSLVRTSQATPGPLQHKPLNALLISTGHYGRAVIPITSPFEEKQRLIQGNQDGPEDGRPAKRRKPNENAPSKSGYAQNLMGATLSLASSRPPSTPSIRYETVRARPNITEPPAPTVDLTSDNDEEEVRGIATVKASVREERPSKERRGKVQRKLKRSPARNGYASNLTGASLTLSCPDKLPARQSKTTVPAAVSIRPTRQESSESSAEIDEDSFDDVESIATKLPAVQKSSKAATRKPVKSPKRTSTPALGSSSPTTIDDHIPTVEASYASNRKDGKPRKRIPIIEDQSSSPQLAELQTPKSTKRLRKPTIQKAPPAIPAAKSSRILQKPPLRNSFTTVPTPEPSGPPASLLRIKSRPPRKMMMLMDRPTSRASDPIESLTSSRPELEPHRTSGLDSSEVVPSQAMLHSDAFCQRQDEVIQTPLNGQHMALSPENIFSSPEDRGIDHQTIDFLLSRKNLPAKAKPVTEQDQTTPKSQDSNHDNQVELSRSGVEKTIQNGPASKFKKISELVSISPVERPESFEAPCPRDANQLLDLNAKAKGERGNSATLGPALQTETLAISPAVAPKCPVDTVAMKGDTERMLTKVSQSSPTMSKLPEHFSNAIQAATDHFRAIIKSSAGSSIQLEAATVSWPDPAVEAEQTDLVPFLHDQKEHTASSDVVVKPSPGPNIEIEHPSIGLEQGKAWNDSAQKVADAPKTRLLNPATRGKSLQSIAANTVDSLAPAFSLMPPPPALQRTTTRPQKPLQRDVAAEERPPAGYEGNRTIVGPWSRESYDLFGSWLPPRGLVNVAQANNG